MELSYWKKTVVGERGWKLNSIKSIYGDNILKQSKPSELDIENYYVNSLIYKDSIFVGDSLNPLNGNHSFTNPTTEASENQNNAKISKDIYDKMYSYYKIVNSKDIDWGNAYLYYATKQDDSIYKHFSYQKINPDTGKVYPISYICSTYIYDRPITSNINNSYELINTLDYVMNRLNAVRFMVNVVLDQRDEINRYNSIHNQQNN